MMSSNLDPPACLGGDCETWFDPTIDPRPDASQLDAASRRKAEDKRTLKFYKLFNRQSGPGLGIVNERICAGTFSDSRACSNDDQIRFLEAPRFGVEVVESTRHAGDDR